MSKKQFIRSEPQCLVGRKFGKLQVVCKSDPTEKSRLYWVCKCECGSTKSIRADRLLCKTTKSCGCLIGEKHGCSKVANVMAEYRIWQLMKKRCFNPKCDAYPYYGGRGITVCEEWVKSFSSFLSNVGQRPSNKHTLDRYPNIYGNYEPGNVRWSVMAEQNRNKRSNVILTHNEITMCLTDWAIHLGISESALRKRLKVWSQSKALSTPPNKHKRNKTWRQVDA